MLQENYRRDYIGEYVVVATKWAGGKKEQIREWIPKQLDNDHISGRAAIIGSGSSVGKFKLSVIGKHRGGLLGSETLQVYATDDIFKTVRCDFIIAKTQEQIDEAAKHSGIIYTNTNNCLNNIGVCHMLPFNYHGTSISEAAYLAAFDGHREVFLLGCDAPLVEPAREKYTKHLLEVMKTYSDTKFIMVDETATVPDKFRYLTNFSIWTYRKFITHCDV